MFGYIYYPGDEAAHVAEEAHHLFSTENALNPSPFTSLRLFENETVQMMADLLNGGPDAAGSLTSGGTESILMAVKTARDKARADVDAMRKAVTPNTILLVGSAPCFPHGVTDPIAEIGKVALEYKIPFHVDSCMGGMMLPFAEKLGYPVPPFDFRVPGVTSISADIHKYGYSPKGVSVIIYASRELRKYQFFVYTDWSGGLYGSPSILGTRCGGPIAAVWASLVHNGLDGYLRMAREVMEASKKIQEGGMY